MQSFVFALRLEQLRSCALVLRLQVHAPRKRTVAESVLSLRRLGPKESEYWLDLNPPSKSPVRRRVSVNAEILLLLHLLQATPAFAFSHLFQFEI